MVRATVTMVVGLVLACASAAGDAPPAPPVITEPQINRIVNGSDVHMEADSFSDADGDAHLCTDWEIWSVNPPARVWSTLCIGGVERVHTHIGDGVFEGSHADLHELLPQTQYRLRVRYRDDSGSAASEWSAWSERDFTTGAATSVFPLEIDDVRDVPAPAWTDSTGAGVVLAPGASLAVRGSDGDVMLVISGLDGVSNQLTNPAAHGEHHAVRVVVSAAAGAALALPESTAAFTDGGGTARTVYLPAVSLGAGQSAYFWVGASGATYVGAAGETGPNFGTLARGAAVPWTVLQNGYKVEVVASGFQLPTNIAFVPTPGAGPAAPLYYVAELYGSIKVVTRDGTVSDYASNLLNFNPTGNFPGSGEQGVAGIAVHPTTGDVYASMVYSSQDGVENVPHYPKVVRFTSSNGGLTAATQTTILNMVGESMGQSHQISNVSFGPDGKLYVHIGDGFTTSTAQNLSSFRGKIIRLNTDGTAPSDNPFYDASNGITARDYVFTYGHRNPFGGAWRAADGMHYEVENGPSVDRICQVVRGRNYLWNGSDASMANFAIYNWNPASGPVNMAFVQPSTFGGSGFPASMQGAMFISESGATWGTGPQAIGKKITWFTLDAAGNRLTGPTPLIDYNGAGKATVVALAAGPDGLYFSDFYKDADYLSPIDRGANILRVRFVGAADFAAGVTTGPAPLGVSFTNTSTAPGQTAWAWDFGDGETSTQQNPTHVYAEEGRYTVRLTVTGSAGVTVAEKVDYVRVGTPPKLALIAVNPPGASDNAVAEYLRAKGFTVDVLNEAPAQRPTAAQIAAGYRGVLVSSTVTSSNVAGEFRTVNTPMLFWENALLRPNRESLTDNGIVTGGTSVNVVDTTHPITQGLSAGALQVYGINANLSLGLGTVGAGTRVLARREGSSDVALMAAEAGATVAGGYVTPARRAFVFLEDNTWLQTTAAGKNLFDRSLFWAMNVSAPSVTQQTGAQNVCPGSPATMSVTVSGTGPFSYQWRKNGQAVPGATRRTYSIASAVAANAGAYDVVVTGIAGTTTSAPAALSVGCACGPADVGSQGGVGGFDGVLDNNDFVVFIDYFFGSDPRADVGVQGGIPGQDGAFDNNDFVVFIDLFFGGC
ncbi:MAG TPA: PQQ-dependent sugar dehydrogenase [Phycisphaerales bacterium]|nr:PQQ-dependent sugar dehydrogenase [Phycisphaerales bacterium]